MNCAKEQTQPRRLTPAYAGNIKFFPAEATHSAAHPRACGENLPWPGFSGTRMPSPPRMRGKFTATCFRRNLYRRTPAHAGKIYCSLREASRSWGGSPPRMRGRLTGRLAFCAIDGPTPAHAGKIFCTEAHPRACGEDLTPCLFIGFSEGSPPRMRGRFLKALRHRRP